jgi:hypothetical protein
MNFSTLRKCQFRQKIHFLPEMTYRFEIRGSARGSLGKKMDFLEQNFGFSLVKIQKNDQKFTFLY